MSKKKRTKKKELEMHLQVSISQQQVVKHNMNSYLCNLCANQQVQMPDYVDGNVGGEEEEKRQQRFIWRISLDTAVHAQPPATSVEEGYGIMRPQSNYFNINLNWHNFVMVDISRGETRVFQYNKITMGKDKNVLCSLQLNFHLENLRRCQHKNATPPDYYISV